MYITSEGARVHCERYGESGPEVLLLHGWGCSAETWRPITQGLCRRARVTAIDFPGHGKSDRPPVPWGAEAYAACVAGVMESLSMRRAHIIGHSHGGRVAIALAAERPTLVEKLVLTGAAGLHGEATARQKRRANTYKRLRAVSDALEGLGIFGPLPEKARELLRRKYGSADYRALDAQMRATFVKVVGFDAAPCLPRIQAPTLLVWGEQDTETPLWMAKRMEKEIPDAGIALLKGTHYAHLEQAALFLRIVETFLLGGTE